MGGYAGYGRGGYGYGVGFGPVIVEGDGDWDDGDYDDEYPIVEPYVEVGPAGIGVGI